MWHKIKEYFKIIAKKIRTIRTIGYGALITILIGISQNISSRSQLEFSFSSQAGGLHQENGEFYYEFRHGGIIKNKSKEKNTITNISLIVWKNDKKEETLRDGFGPSWMVDNGTGEKIKLPLIIEGREAVDVDIYNKFPIKGTTDEYLLTTRKPVVPGSLITLPVYDYQLTFTDINDNEFDENGVLVNRDAVDMNWTLENYCRKDRYKFWSCNLQKLKILDSKLMFKLKTFFHWLGMESIGDSIYKIGTHFEK